MKNNNLMSLFKILILITSIALVFTCCLGSEEDDDTTKTAASLTEDNAPKSAGAAIQATNITGAFSSLGGVGSSSVSSMTREKSPLGRTIEKALSIRRVQRSTAELFAQGSIPRTTGSCTDGGSVTMSASWVGPDNPSDASEMVDFTATMNFSSCQEGTETQNGTFTLTFNGPLDNPTGLTLTAPNYSYSNTATDDSVTMTNVSLTISVPVITGDDITGGTFSLDGAISGTADGDPINQEYDDFQLAYSSGITGETLSISGSLKANCIGGWVTIVTNTPIFVSTGADCPTEGEVTITSGDNTVKAVVASNYTIAIYFNDTLVQTYTNCEEVDGLCTG